MIAPGIPLEQQDLHQGWSRPVVPSTEFEQKTVGVTKDLSSRLPEGDPTVGIPLFG